MRSVLWQVQEPLPLIVHHLPIAVTFAFISDDNILVRNGQMFPTLSKLLLSVGVSN